MVRRGRRLHSPTNSETFEFGPVAEDEAALADLLLAVMSDRALRVSMSYLDGARGAPSVSARAAAESARRLVVRVRAQPPSVLVTGSWAAYEAALAKGFRSDLRRCRRRLGERGEVHVGVCTAGDDVDDALADLLRLEAAGWKGTQGTAIASRPPVRRFYAELTRWAAAKGSLRLFSLRLDDRAVAALFALEERGTLYAMKSGYDPALRRLSPGKVLLHAVLEHAFTAGLDRVELLGVDDPYKRNWSNGYRDSLELEAFGRSPAAMAQWVAVAHGRPLAARLGAGRALRASQRAWHGRRGSRSPGSTS
jgi:CelD/BcsL family acetyltransferase involved in cellulose biosynthesis